MCFLSEVAFINPTFRPFDGDDVGREGFFSQVDVCVLLELPEVLEGIDSKPCPLGTFGVGPTAPKESVIAVKSDTVFIV